ncbi:hypothetical protein ABK040_008492 [Willaertia magna]
MKRNRIENKKKPEVEDDISEEETSELSSSIKDRLGFDGNKLLNNNKIVEEESSEDEDENTNLLSTSVSSSTSNLKTEEDDDVYVSDDEIDFEIEKENIQRDDDEDEEDVKVYETFTNLSSSVNEEKEESKKSMVDYFREDPNSLFYDVHDSDDSEEDESQVNTIGNVPIEWYDEYDHIGYDRQGKKIFRKKQKDALDHLIARHDDPNYIRTVYDEVNDREVVLSNKDLQTIIDISVKGRYAPGFDAFREQQEYVKIDSRFPMVGNSIQKKKFLPNKDEYKKISKLALRYKRNPKTLIQEPKPEKPKVYLMWGEDGSVINGASRISILPPPKEKLPDHTLSYRPPAEYPDVKIYDSLRHVPVYDDFVKERFERCLDLYLAPRVKPKKEQIIEDPDSLLPQLPKPEELRPYPEIQSLIYEGHQDKVRSISVDPTGKWLASASDDGTARLWEIDTGRCRHIWQFNEPPKWIEWNPNPKLNLLAVAAGLSVYLIKPEESGNEVTNELTEDLFPEKGFEDEEKDQYDVDNEEEEPKEENEEKASDEERDEEEEKEISGKSVKGRTVKLVTWKFYRSEEGKSKRTEGVMCEIIHHSVVTQVTWHTKGDYFASLAPNSYSQGILIHQISHRGSQKVFKEGTKVKNASQKYIRIMFHPKKPHFYVVSTRMVRIYNLAKQTLTKKLKGQKCQYVSSLAIHPSGNHVLIGGFDERMEWFDLAISSRPYKTLRFHKRAIRAVDFHKRYPLFATSSDDCTTNVFHGMVYEDWTKETMIVPVKILKGHKKTDYLGVLDCKFHPIQPWLFTAGADSTIRLYTS